MTVPNTFANATTAIPLVQLDQNFNTAITLGNTTVFLGNTTTSFGNVTLNAPTFTTAALGTPASGNLTNCTGVTITARTRQVFLTGTAATYTTPANCKQILVRMKAGGGGGNGSGLTGAATDGGIGGTTTFNAITSIGGNGGNTTVSGTAGVGGTGGTGTASIRLPGQGGISAGFMIVNATNYQGIGGAGGGNGGGRGAIGNLAGSAGGTNTGGGGASGSWPSSLYATVYAASSINGGGGGEGEYAELLINSPSATYTYTVGAGGTAGAAGTGGQAGGAGGAGYIIVDEYY